MCPYPFFEATPPGAAPGPPNIKTGARVRLFWGCNNGQVCSRYFYCWSENLVGASVAAGSQTAAATAAQKAREDRARLDGQHRKAEAAAVRVAAEEAERRRVEDNPAACAVADNVERQRVEAEAAERGGGFSFKPLPAWEFLWTRT